MPATKGSGRTRCRMHGGCHHRNKTHGRLTIQAQAERKQQAALLKEMKASFKEMEQELKESEALRKKMQPFIDNPDGCSEKQALEALEAAEKILDKHNGKRLPKSSA